MSCPPLLGPAPGEQGRLVLLPPHAARVTGLDVRQPEALAVGNAERAMSLSMRARISLLGMISPSARSTLRRLEHAGRQVAPVLTGPDESHPSATTHFLPFPEIDQLKVAGLESLFPEVSTALTWKVCAPPARLM